jgi:TRAP-type C4-dicarboxylate transport system permease small subunit
MISPTLGTEDEAGWKICLKAAKWAGRIGVLFAFAFMIMALVFGSTGAPDSGWIAETTAWGMKLAIFFGVFSLVTAAFGFALRRRQNTTADRDKVHTGKQAV